MDIIIIYKPQIYGYNLPLNELLKHGEKHFIKKIKYYYY